MTRQEQCPTCRRWLVSGHAENCPALAFGPDDRPFVLVDPDAPHPTSALKEALVMVGVAMVAFVVAMSLLWLMIPATPVMDVIP